VGRPRPSLLTSFPSCPCGASSPSSCASWTTSCAPSYAFFFAFAPSQIQTRMRMNWSPRKMMTQTRICPSSAFCVSPLHAHGCLLSQSFASDPRRMRCGMMTSCLFRRRKRKKQKQTRHQHTSSPSYSSWLSSSMADAWCLVGASAVREARRGPEMPVT